MKKLEKTFHTINKLCCSITDRAKSTQNFPNRKNIFPKFKTREAFEVRTHVVASTFTMSPQKTLYSIIYYCNSAVLRGRFKLQKVKTKKDNVSK